MGIFKACAFAQAFNLSVFFRDKGFVYYVIDERFYLVFGFLVFYRPAKDCLIFRLSLIERQTRPGITDKVRLYHKVKGHIPYNELIQRTFADSVFGGKYSPYKLGRTLFYLVYVKGVKGLNGELP